LFDLLPGPGGSLHLSGCRLTTPQLCALLYRTQAGLGSLQLNANSLSRLDPFFLAVLVSKLQRADLADTGLTRCLQRNFHPPPNQGARRGDPGQGGEPAL
jgi:hypothetical protein